VSTLGLKTPSSLMLLEKSSKMVVTSMVESVVVEVTFLESLTTELDGTVTSSSKVDDVDDVELVADAVDVDGVVVDLFGSDVPSVVIDVVAEVVGSAGDVAAFSSDVDDSGPKLVVVEFSAEIGVDGDSVDEVDCSFDMGEVTTVFVVEVMVDFEVVDVDIVVGVGMLVDEDVDASVSVGAICFGVDDEDFSVDVLIGGTTSDVVVVDVTIAAVV